MCDKCKPDFEMFRPVISLNRVKKPFRLKIRDWFRRLYTHLST